MIIVIAGPTGVGKTKLSIELAKAFNGEVINADSTQVYRGMDIGTAKVTEEEKENIPHHLFDIKNVDEIYTVYDYQRDCRRCIDDIIKRGKTPIMVGGTGLYIKAALYNYNFNEEGKSYDYSQYNNQELYEQLLKVDSKSNIHPNNRKRIERALTYYRNSGIPISTNPKSEKLLYDTYFIGLTTDRNQLYDRINKRVDKMVSDGLIEEARKFYDLKMYTKAIMTPICYKELFMYFNGEKELAEVLDLIRQRSRKYAKRQYTWFNHQLTLNWYEVNFKNFNQTIDKIKKDIIEKEKSH